MFRKINFVNPKETRKTLITEFLTVIAEALIALLTAKKKSEEYYNTVGWSIVGIVGIMFINELAFIVSMQVTAISGLIQIIKAKLKKKSKAEPKEKPKQSLVDLALPTHEKDEVPTLIRVQTSIASEPELFMDEDQPSPENIPRIRASKNFGSRSPFDRNLHLPSWSPIISRRQTASNLLTTPVSPLSGDNPPPCFEERNSIIIEEPAGSINAERLSTIIPMVDKKTVQEFNPDV